MKTAARVKPAIKQSPMTIGALAKATCATIDTIRFYEKSGLLPKPTRRASGYREYSVDDVRRVQCIRRARELGFSLEEITALLQLRTPTERGVAKVRAVAEAKLKLVEAKILELEKLKMALSHLVNACPGSGDPRQCPILNAFDNEPSV